MLNLAVYPLILTAVIMLALAAEDYWKHSVKGWRSYVFEVAIIVGIMLNFIVNWESALMLLVVGLALYFAAIPVIKLALREYNFRFYDLDREVFLLTLCGWPFISLFAFLGNQLANIAYGLGRRMWPSWSNEMPQLVVYGIVWFLIGIVMAGLYIH